MGAIKLEEIVKINEIKLDLMDWKAMEKQAETEIRRYMAVIALNELARKEAKKMIKKFGGDTSEEELAESKKKIAENLKEISITG